VLTAILSEVPVSPPLLTNRFAAMHLPGLLNIDHGAVHFVDFKDLPDAQVLTPQNCDAAIEPEVEGGAGC